MFVNFQKYTATQILSATVIIIYIKFTITQIMFSAQQSIQQGQFDAFDANKYEEIA
jgi:hypothetical protein